MKKFDIFLAALLLIFAWSCDNNDDPEPKETIASNHIRVIYIDNSGIKWFGTDKGLSAFDGDNWSTYTSEDYLSSNKVSDIAFQDGGSGSEIWLATENGASVLAVELDAITTATTYSGSNSDIIGNNVLSVGLDVDDNRWFGTTEGISVFSGQSWTSTDHAGTLSDYPVVDIGADQEGTTFLGTNGAGIAVMEYKTDALTTVTYYEHPWSPVPETNTITSVYVDTSGNQWYGTHGGVLEHNSLDAKSDWNVYTMDSYGIPSDDVMCVTGDQQGIIWIGTLDAGVASFDGSTWTNYSIQDGLISNQVNAIAVDIDGSVWFGTDAGVSHFQGGTWTTYQAE